MAPSKHHAYLQANLIAALKKLPNYTVFSELTLQISLPPPDPSPELVEGNRAESKVTSTSSVSDYTPDVCLYPKQHINVFEEDIIRMTEMPLLAVEVLSPSQAAQVALDKFKVYFQAGIQSCWLVIPTAYAVIVYTSPQQAQSFNNGDVVDKTLNIRIPISEIFE
jgi:Uma2 family endonuclease